MLKNIAQLISWLALVGLVAPSILFLSGRMELDSVKLWMMIATVVWFVFASLWMWNSDEEQAEDNG